MKQVALFSEDIPIHTVYFGGGTPSLVSPDLFMILFDSVRQSFSICDDAEISLEANPGTVTLESLTAYRRAGFNRISFGMQSARVDELNLLERQHNPEDITKAIHYARTAGFDNINLDLIFGLPGQTLEAWKESLSAALDFHPEHLSLYSLIVEEGTPLARRISAGITDAPDDDVAAEQYEWTCEYLDAAGFDHYEISNWALKQPRRDLRCQHNLQYWRLLPYYGFGCGAVGFLPAGFTWFSSSAPVIMQNPKWIGAYTRQVEEAAKNTSVTDFLETVDADYEMNTFMFTGFRLLQEGINPERFHHRFGKEIDSVFGRPLRKLFDAHLIETAPDGAIRLKRSAWLVANRIFREFTGDD